MVSRTYSYVLSKKERDNNYYEAATRNLLRTEQIRMLALKLNLTKKASIIDRIADLIDKIIEEEYEYLPGMIAAIKAST